MTATILLGRILKGALVMALFTAAIPVEAANPSAVLAWGANYYGQTLIPSGLSGVSAIAAGAFHSVALKNDRTVVAWGYNDVNGQTTVPAGLSGVTAIAAGRDHTVALKSDGTVASWGTVGQSSVPANLSGVTAIAAGSLHTVVLKNDGTVVAWGNNGYGQTTVPAGLSGVTAIAAPGYHTVVLRADGTVVAWGNNDDGQTNVPAGLSGVTAIAAGGNTTVVLKSDGTVVAWGNNRYGQTTVPAGLSGVTAIAAGGYHTVALKNDGTVVAWGYNGYGQTTSPGGLSGVTAIAAGQDHTMVIVPVPPNIIVQPLSLNVNVTSNASFTVTAPGTAPLSYQWSKDGVSIVGATNTSLTVNNVQTNQAGNYTVAITNAYGSVTSNVAVLTVNRLAQTISFGPLPGKQADAAPFTMNATASSSLPVSYTSSNPGVAIVSGSVLTITGNGITTITANQAGDSTYLPATSVSQALGVGVVAWGNNTYGQTNVPAGLGGVAAIAAGGYHTVALKSDGTVKAWGDNSYGQTTVPTALSGVTAIAAGFNHTVALKFDGTVVAWGRNSSGETSVPSGLTGVTAISAGNGHTVALRSNGTMVAWGFNYFGQATVPGGLIGVTAIAAGGYHTVALINNDTVFAMGVGTYSILSVPMGLNAVSAIAAGDEHTVALRFGGQVVAWGNNGSGQTSVPTGVGEVSAIAASDSGGSGRAHTVALRGDGTVVAWGSNNDGQSSVPAVLGRVSAIAAGGLHTVVLHGVSTLVRAPTISQPSQSVAVAPGSDATFAVSATSVAPLSYQWFKDGVIVAGQTNAQINLSGLTNRARGGSFSVMVSNLYGAVTGNIGSLRVRVPHRLQPLVVTSGMFRLLSADQDGGLLTANDLPYFSVQTSTNLAATNWLSFTYTNGLSLTNGMLRFDDTNAASRTFRYYRVMEQ